MLNGDEKDIFFLVINPNGINKLNMPVLFLLSYLYTPNSINAAFFNSLLFEALCEKSAPTKPGLIGSITNLLNVLYLSDILLKYSLNERRQ